MYLEQQPPPPQALNIRDVITLTARLAQLLAEEVDLLAAMKIAKIQDLQKEKQFLIGALESHKKLVRKHPHLIDTIPSRDKHDLEAVVHVFEDILQENHSKLVVAREVNQRIVQAIAEVVKETSNSRIYNGQGTAGTFGSESLSITLNQTA